jgi:hypothetical protein
MFIFLLVRRARYFYALKITEIVTLLDVILQPKFYVQLLFTTILKHFVVKTRSVA